MNAQETGLRVEEILARLDASEDPTGRAVAEDLVRALMDFYGAGLARLAALLHNPGADGAAVLADELVTGLLVLHDLHPHDVETRIALGLASVSGHAAELLGFDRESATLRLRVPAASGGCGCGGTDGGTDTVREAIEGALACFAPEVESIELEQAPAAPAEPALLQIGSRPPGSASVTR